MSEEKSIFTRIRGGEIPGEMIHEDERTFAIMDINPWTRGHALVIPKAEYRDLEDIDPDDLAACAHTAQLIARRALDRLGADGVNLLNACRPAAWQSVFHFHIHVIPRYEGDPLQLPVMPQSGDQEEIAAAAAEYRGE